MGDVVVDELAKAHHQQAAPLVRVVQISSWGGFSEENYFPRSAYKGHWLLESRIDDRAYIIYYVMFTLSDELKQSEQKEVLFQSCSP